MKKLFRLFLFVLVFVLLVAAALPVRVQASTGSSKHQGDLVRLTIVNKSDGKVYLKLEGSQMYSFVVLKNTTKVYTPQRGLYSYTLTACDQTVNGKLDLTIYRDLLIPECGGKVAHSSNNHAVDLPAEIRPISLVVDNQNHKTVYIKLEGDRTYNFKVSRNTNTVFSTEPGKYTYTVTACGTSVQGKLDLTRYKIIRIPVCGASPSGVASEHEVFLSFSDQVKASFYNGTGKDAVVTLKGAKTYHFYLPAGVTKTYTVLRGQYSYESFACGQTLKGKFEARNNEVLKLVCP